METTELIPIELIDPNPYQPRQAEDLAAVAEIAASIKANGLLQIPTARRVNGRVQLAFGHTRKAAFALNGEPCMPLIIRDLDDLQMFELGVAENIKRRDLNPLEQAEAMRRYMDEFGKSSVEAGEFFNVSPETVRGTVRLNNLPDEAKTKLKDGGITIDTARQLLTVQKLAPQAVAKALKEIDEGESPREALSTALRRNGEIEDMWDEGWRSGKPLAGSGLWPLDMKRFPNNLLPEFNAQDLVFALQVQEDERICEMIGRLDLAGVLLDINRLLDELKRIGIPLSDEEVAERVKHLVAPPACTACPFYARMGGIHYCGMKSCHARKENAWNRHLVQNASQKLGLAIYDEKVDGPKRVLQHGEYGLVKTKKADCRLLPKDQVGRTYYQYIQDVPDCVLVVLVGKSLEKIKEEETKLCKEVRGKNAAERRAKQLEEQVKALLWEVTPCFHGIFDHMPLEAVQALWDLSDEAFHWAIYETTQKQEESPVDCLTVNVICQAIEWYDSMEPKDVAEEVQKLAKTWKVKLPKDWSQRMQALGQFDLEEE